jgi:hypothetical protein
VIQLKSRQSSSGINSKSVLRTTKQGIRPLRLPIEARQKRKPSPKIIKRKQNQMFYREQIETTQNQSATGVYKERDGELLQVYIRNLHSAANE